MSKELTEYQFTPEERALLEEYRNAIVNLQAQQQGALNMILKTRKLEGPWDVAGDRLVKRQEPKPGPQVVKDNK
jgi:hypothetical protein